MAYELPFLLAAASVAMAAGTLSLPGIVEAVAAVVAALAAARRRASSSSPGLAELQRPPFDMPVADSEIIFGAYTEYTGLRFALFLLAEYAGIVVLCALTDRAVPRRLARARSTPTGLGWRCGPWSKTFVLAFVVIWLRVSYPRLREDQLQRLAWQGLVPLALAQLALTGVVEVAMRDEGDPRRRPGPRASPSRCAR